MHSYANPDNEERAREIVAEYARERSLPWHVSVSSAPDPRDRLLRADEHDDPRRLPGSDRRRLPRRPRRGARATGLCGDVHDQADQLGDLLDRQGAPGSDPDPELGARPARAAAGVAVAAALGHRDSITFDMGGTSCDVCLLLDGAPLTSTQSVVEGHHLQLTATDIATIGAGGGSIVAMDAGGLPRVGPQSAGASPGPAGYGRGGTEPTVHRRRSDPWADRRPALPRLGVGGWTRVPPATRSDRSPISSGSTPRPSRSRRAFALVNRTMAGAVAEAGGPARVRRAPRAADRRRRGGATARLRGGRAARPAAGGGAPPPSRCSAPTGC